MILEIPFLPLHWPQVSWCGNNKAFRKSCSLLCKCILFFCRPYHALLLLNDEKSLLNELPLDCSPALVRVIKTTSAVKNLQQLAQDADLALLQVRGAVSSCWEPFKSQPVFSCVLLLLWGSSLSVSREQGERTSPGAWGKAGGTKGAGTVQGSPAATSHLISDGNPFLWVSSPHLLRTSPLKQAGEKLLFKLWTPPELPPTASLSSIRVEPFLISNGNFPLFSLCMLPQDLSLCPSEESGSVFSVPPVW